MNYGEPTSQKNPWDVHSNEGCNLGMQDARRLRRAHGTENYDSVLERTSTYYNVLFRCYSILPSTTPVLLCIPKYYSGTTPYNKVLLRTIKYYSLTIPYNSVL